MWIYRILGIKVALVISHKSEFMHFYFKIFKTEAKFRFLVVYYAKTMCCIEKISPNYPVIKLCIT